MSVESEEISAHIDSVDVDISSTEKAFVCEITSDSGVDTLESYSAAYPGSSDSDLSPVKQPDNVLPSNEIGSCPTDGIESESSLSSPFSISPDSNDLSDNALCGKEFSLTKAEDIDSNFTKDVNNELLLDINQITASVPDSKAKNEAEVTPSYQFTGTDINNVSNREFTTSTVSLNDQNTFSNNVAICKSPYSRSAENISTIEPNPSDKSSSNKDINADQILSDFTSQKSKVLATQKIPENPHNPDYRYARLPKELIPQDLGSIVKNVHGIFSTVSGSLKNAYNNTHRMSMQKAPVRPISKPIPNGKVMNDIFEDEIVEEKPPKLNGMNKTEGSSESLLNIGSDTKSEHDTELESDSKKDVLKLQVETLERLLAEQRKENGTLRERVKQQMDELQDKDQTFKELEAKLDAMGKRVELAEREKDAAVMRYASVECAGIEARRAADRAAAAEKAAKTEADLLNNKLKSAHSEKQRICQLYDDKCHELSNSEREAAKLREDIKELEGRLKWTQSKLRMEMDAYKDSAERVEKLTQQVSELEAAKDAAATSASDGAKAKQLEAELKESQAALILCRHERDELEKKFTTASQQLDTCVKERDIANEALARSTAEVEELKIRNLQLEEEAAELAALRAQAALADTLSAQLQRETERWSRAEASLSEARALAETCARREAGALEHAARLTAQHVALSQAARSHHDTVQALTADNASLRERATSLEQEIAALQSALGDAAERRHKENKVLARKVAELTEEVAEANKKLEWEKGEIGVLKKKHASAIKELNRELQRALKRCEQLEAKLPPPDAPSTRTGSVSSLSSGESAPQEDRLQNGHADVPDIQVREPDRQALIERIVSLQRAAARRAERCEFLEEHAKQLTGELRAKANLLRHLLCSMPAGAVASQDRDANKVHSNTFFRWS
ncbi:coiled-coil domain-containing protein 186-like [Ostrinia furnacalis]|uniref:coiled-coil domain-containing protein 186-like n=1 Tax=Ostrinia furnacalis TaxID=93504 RepID=UPI0010394EFA|nr:coiled-coil domain-containing protein 186-like [Ostrinia furnacalis]